MRQGFHIITALKSNHVDCRISVHNTRNSSLTIQNSYLNKGGTICIAGRLDLCTVHSYFHCSVSVWSFLKSRTKDIMQHRATQTVFWSQFYLLISLFFYSVKVKRSGLQQRFLINNIISPPNPLIRNFALFQPYSYMTRDPRK